MSKCNTEHNKIDNPNDFWDETEGIRGNFWSMAYKWYDNSRKGGIGDTKITLCLRGGSSTGSVLSSSLLLHS